jgi:hypothetical protein
MHYWTKWGWQNNPAKTLNGLFLILRERLILWEGYKKKGDYLENDCLSSPVIYGRCSHSLFSKEYNLMDAMENWSV